MGDPSGIGPEIIAQALRHVAVRRVLVPVVFGDASFASAMEKVGPPEGASLCAVSALPVGSRRPGRPTRAGGRAQLSYVRATIDAARNGLIDALCTAPVSKEQISRAGFRFMGHTELLAKAFKARVLMLMDGPRLRIALATNHIAIKDVPSALNAGKLCEQLVLLSNGLAPSMKRPPRIAVCALNPHAGEGGLLGREELTAIRPAIARARKRGIDCHGPFAADGLFARASQLAESRHGQGQKFGFDAVLAMYHDQGLVVAKAIDFERTVNVTLGLPVPRTSPDHGVAYELAGRNEADPTPMVEALLRAAELARHRNGRSAGSNAPSAARPSAMIRRRRLNAS